MRRGTPEAVRVGGGPAGCGREAACFPSRWARNCKSPASSGSGAGGLSPQKSQSGHILFCFLEDSRLAVCYFQAGSRGAQPYTHTYPFSPKLPSQPGCCVTLNRVPWVYCRTLVVTHFLNRAHVLYEEHHRIIRESGAGQVCNSENALLCCMETLWGVGGIGGRQGGLRSPCGVVVVT